MADGDPVPRPIPALLRERLAEKDMSVRGLARLMMGDDPKKIESRRRLLQRYLKGDVEPSTKMAIELAAALDAPPETFVTDADLRISAQETIVELTTSIEQMRDELRRLADVARIDAGQPEAISGHLAELEATVARQGEAMTRALDALATEVRALGRQPERRVPPASGAAG